MRRADGQALLTLVGVLWLGLLSAVLLGGVASALGARGDRQRAADLAALSAARSMRAYHDRLFEPRRIGGRANPRHLSRARYLELARAAAIKTAAGNGANVSSVRFGQGGAPTRVTVAVASAVRLAGVDIDGTARAEGEVTPEAGAGLGPLLSGAAGEYQGPFATRQGKPMRPDVAAAFDRLSRAAGRDGIGLIVVSAFRSDTEQAVLFAKNPDPKWVAPPGRSMHRLGTELDLGPKSAYGWLARNAKRFGFVQRMSWEPWHYGYTRNAGSASVGFGGDGEGGTGVPDYVPSRFQSMISVSAQRWNVAAGLLAAQIWQESRFDPNARSRAGAQGIAQFMPGTARAYGLRDPFDPRAAIDAQAHHMRDLLREFGAVPLALAAYNAGAGRVKACACVPAIPETVNYVAAILARMRGAGDPLATSGELEVRLVR